MLDAALHVFAEPGYASTNLDRVAAAAGPILPYQVIGLPGDGRRSARRTGGNRVQSDTGYV